MAPIKQIGPIDYGEKGEAVSNLHAGLQFIIKNQRGINPNVRRTLLRELKPDVDNNTYGQATLDLLGHGRAS